MARNLYTSIKKVLGFPSRQKSGYTPHTPHAPESESGENKGHRAHISGGKSEEGIVAKHSTAPEPLPTRVNKLPVEAGSNPDGLRWEYWTGKGAEDGYGQFCIESAFGGLGSLDEKHRALRKLVAADERRRKDAGPDDDGRFLRAEELVQEGDLIFSGAVYSGVWTEVGPGWFGKPARKPDDIYRPEPEPPRYEKLYRNVKDCGTSRRRPLKEVLVNPTGRCIVRDGSPLGKWSYGSMAMVRERYPSVDFGEAEVLLPESEWAEMNNLPYDPPPAIRPLSENINLLNAHAESKTKSFSAVWSPEFRHGSKIDRETFDSDLPAVPEGYFGDWLNNSYTESKGYPLPHDRDVAILLSQLGGGYRVMEGKVSEFPGNWFRCGSEKEVTHYAEKIPEPPIGSSWVFDAPLPEGSDVSRLYAAFLRGCTAGIVRRRSTFFGTRG